MHIAIVQQPAANQFASTALKKHIVRHHHRCTAIDLQDRAHMLNEVELLVAGRRPEVVADNNQRLALFVAIFANHGDARLFAERRIGQHHVEFN